MMLVLATVGFAVNFWAWALLSPLGPRFKDALHLSSFQQALLVAVPVVVGSLGRIPVGALTDHYGGRVMLPLVSAATVVPVLYLGLAGHSSPASLLIGGFFLGFGGTAFAVGVPFVNGWFPLIYRRRTTTAVFTATTRNDKAMYVLLITTLLLGLGTTVLGNLTGHPHDYRQTVAPWFRSVFYLHPDTNLILSAPIGFRLHVLSAWVLFAFWPFSRLVHVFSAPIGYLTRPYIVYRSRDPQLGNRAPRPGWEKTR